MASIPRPHERLQPEGVLRLIAYGAFLWFVGVLFLRFAATAGWLSGVPQAIVYVLVIPATWPLIALAPRIGGIGDPVRATAIVSLTALLIDGIVVGVVPWVYSADEALARACAAALLWGVGVALALAFVVPPRST